MWIEYQTDIDGCVIELNDLTGFQVPARHITLCPKGAFSLKEVKGMLKKYVNLLNGIPTVAIGGINLQRAEQVCATGVGSIAVVSAITQADDPQLVIDTFQQILAENQL